MIEFVYHQTKHFFLDCSSFQAMYEYESIFDERIESDVIKERVLTAKERVEQLQKLREELTNQ